MSLTAPAITLKRDNWHPKAPSYIIKYKMRRFQLQGSMLVSWWASLGVCSSRHCTTVLSQLVAVRWDTHRWCALGL